MHEYVLLICKKNVNISSGKKGKKVVNHACHLSFEDMQITYFGLTWGVQDACSYSITPLFLALKLSFRFNVHTDTYSSYYALQMQVCEMDLTQ